MTGGQGWRRLSVVRRIQETEEIVSLHLAAADGAPLAPFLPGQFLTFRIVEPGGRAAPRSYSISSDPADLSQYRISVRRHPGGMGSSHMREAMPVGATIEATGPKGRFVLDGTTQRPAILLAGGIGVTPLTAMAHALARSGRRACLIQACRASAARPFAAELDALAARAPNLMVAAAMSGLGGDGRITADMLRSLLPIGDYEGYLCGPPDFMQAMFDLLLRLGVREERIACEFFRPARELRPGGAPIQAPAPAAPPASERREQPLVAFRRSGLAVRWDGSRRTLLDFAEAQGLAPAFSCRNGVCSTCLCAAEGQVRYIEEPLDEPGPGQALLCCSVPVGDVTLDI